MAMRFLASLVLMGLVLEPGVGLQALQGPSASATVEDVRPSGVDGLEFVLRNRSDKAVSAVALSVSVTLSSGETRSNRLAKDFLASEPADIEGAASAERARGRIPPGHGRTIQTAQPVLPGESATDVKVTVDALIFEDATAVGDEAILSILFDQREERLSDLKRLSAAILQARARLNPIEVLQAFAQLPESRNEATPEELKPFGVTAPQGPQPDRRTIKSFSQGALPAVVDQPGLASQAVDHLSTLIRQKTELLSRHSVRRK